MSGHARSQEMAGTIFIQHELGIGKLFPEGSEQCCAQVSPPGMHMLHLCFADDIRNPESDPNLVGTSFPVANDDQIAAAEAMIDKLSMGESAYVGMFQNPMLQRHYQVGLSPNQSFLPPNEFEGHTGVCPACGYLRCEV